MSHSCCNKKLEDADLNSLWRRSISLITTGSIMMLPGLEHTLMMGNAGIASFAFSSLLLIDSVINDFKDTIWFLLNSLTSVSLIIFSPYISVLAFQYQAVGIGLSILGASIFLKQDVHNHEISFSLPSLDKIIMLSSSITWLLAGSNLFSTITILDHVMLHDALLSIGFFSFGNYIRQSLQTKILENNHNTQIQILKDDGTYEHIKLNQLKKGMRVQISKPVSIPVDCTVYSDTCEINDDIGEVIKEESKGKNIPAFSLIHNGTLICNEDYKPSNNNQVAGNSDPLLKFFLGGILGISMASGLITGLATGSIISGIQYFAMNFMSACPCVFLVTKPIIQDKALKWGKRNNFEPKITPSLDKPNIIVFDRTNTLYEQDPNDVNAPYRLIAGAKDLLQNLKNKGIEVFILSGHSTQGHEQNLEICKRELKDLVKTENIIFDKKYNGLDSQKSEAIKNLKRFGSVEKPETQSFLKSFTSDYFQNKVWMIGDGINDANAIKEADVGICIGRTFEGDVSYNDEVAKHSNLITSQDNITSIDKLLDIFETGISYQNLFTGIALVYNTFMLSAVNGAFYSLLGFTLTPAMACLGMSAFCTTLIVSSSIINISGEPEDSPTNILINKFNEAKSYLLELIFDDESSRKSSCCCKN